MSKFYGSITGSAKTAATRCGTKKSGIESHTSGWDQGVRVSGSVSEFRRGKPCIHKVHGVDGSCFENERFDIYLTGGSTGKSNDKYIGSLEDGKWIPAKTEGGTQ
jgi:hypothetical protein